MAHAWRSATRGAFAFKQLSLKKPCVVEDPHLTSVFRNNHPAARHFPHTQFLARFIAADEGPHEAAGRSGQDALGRSTLRNLATFAKHYNLVAKAESLFDVVRHENHRFANLSLQAHKFVLKLAPNNGVDGAKWLVHEQDLGLCGQCASDPHTLALPTRKLRGIARTELGVEAHAFKKLQRRRSGLAPRRAVKNRHGGNVIRNGAMRHQAAVLKHVTDGSAEFDGIGFTHVSAIDENSAGGWLNHAVDHAK